MPFGLGRPQEKYFHYLGYETSTDPLSHWVTLSHRLRPRVKLDANYRMFAHVAACSEMPEYLRFVPAWAESSIETSAWEPGCVYEFVTHHRLHPGSYDVLVGFAAGSMRLEIGGMGDRLPVGKLSVELPPVTHLPRAAPLVAAESAKLLNAILALPAARDDTSEHLEACYAQAPQFGHVLEFGVATGTTVTRLGIVAPWREVWGFDSFEGLPEDWDRGNTVVPAGTFAVAKSLPVVPPNVRLVVGWFDDSLPRWLDEHPGNIAFLHIDVDLYSSARFVLDALNDRIVPGTVIVFDDLGMWSSLQRGSAGPYPRWEEHEWRAMIEWMSSHGRVIAPISRMPDHVLGVRVLV